MEDYASQAADAIAHWTRRQPEQHSTRTGARHASPVPPFCVSVVYYFQSGIPPSSLYLRCTKTTLPTFWPTVAA